MSRRSLALLALLLVVPMGVGVGAANREHQQLMADLRMLQEQTQQLQLLITHLTDALKAVNGKLDDQSGVNRKAFADQKLQADTLTGDVRTLREKVDDTNVRISTLSQELEALRLTIPKMTQAAPVEPGAVAPAEAGATPAAPTAPVSVGTSPTRLYQSAYADYTAGQYDLAIAGFEMYIKTFPKSEQADNAQFYIGQSFYSAGKYKEAIAAFDRVISDYPNGDAAPDAYYKRGLAYDQVGQPARARESFEMVIKKYPDNMAAQLAKQALERLNQPIRD